MDRNGREQDRHTCKAYVSESEPECSESCKKNTCRITGSDLRHLDGPIALSHEGRFEVNDCANEVLIIE